MFYSQPNLSLQDALVRTDAAQNQEIVQQMVVASRARAFRPCAKATGVLPAISNDHHLLSSAALRRQGLAARHCSARGCGEPAKTGAGSGGAGSGAPRAAGIQPPYANS